LYFVELPSIIADLQRQINELRAFSNINRALATENQNTGSLNRNAISDAVASLAAARTKLDGVTNGSLAFFEAATVLIEGIPLLGVFAVPMRAYVNALKASA
jgi:hypothetical protein